MVHQVHIILFLLNAAAVLAAALVDTFTRKIPNIFVVIMLCCSVTFWATAGIAPIFSHLISGVYAGAVGFLLFVRGKIGGGDVKMITALATWFVPQQLVMFVLWVLMCGGIIGALYLALIALRLFLERFTPKIPLPNIDPKAGMAYGLATACGFAVSAWRVFA